MSCAGSVRTAGGSCNCCPAVFKVTSTCTGNLQGALVQVYSDAAYTILIASGYTDVNGLVTLLVGRVGTYYVTRSMARFISTNTTTTTTSCTSTTPNSGAIAPDTSLYVCIPGCPIPVSKTLHCTDIYGTVTLAYIGALQWQGIGNVPLPQGTAPITTLCPVTSTPTTYTFSAAGSISMSVLWYQNATTGCPGSYPHTNPATTFGTPPPTPVRVCTPFSLTMTWGFEGYFYPTGSPMTVTE